MSIYPQKKYIQGTRRTEFDVLKSSHKFLRDEHENIKDLSWDDAVARKYYASLFREYAVCDLKHFKSGNIALRWRTEDEVLSGAGETSCGNTRCKHHASTDTPPLSSIASRPWDDDTGPSSSVREDRKHRRKKPKLLTLELPFAYEEDGESKSALVKVVLCERCYKKVNWKREHDKQAAADERSIPATEERLPISVSNTHPEPSRSRSPLVRPPRRSRSRSPRYGHMHDVRDQWST